MCITTTRLHDQNIPVIIDKRNHKYLDEKWRGGYQIAYLIILNNNK